VKFPGPTRRRHHLHSDLGGLSLPGGRARCVQPSDRRLVDGHDSRHPAGGGCLEHGACDTEAEGRDPPLRPGLPIHLHRVRPSLPRSGRAPLNGLSRRRLRHAMCESFFATLECELLDRRRFKTQAEARTAVFEFIEGFYNPRRRHSSIGYLSASSCGQSRRTPACRRARGRQGQALRAAPKWGRP
jgi:hypothetical protein